MICERNLDCVDPFFEGSISVEIISSLPNDQKFMTYHLSDCAEITETHMNQLIRQLSERFSLDEIVPVSSKHPVRTVFSSHFFLI